MRTRSFRRGYTIIEVLIALTLLVLGVGGIVAMQRYAATANRNAHQLAVANQLARTWLERLRSDAVAWNHPSPVLPAGDDLADTALLGILPTTGTVSVTPWTRPAPSTALSNLRWSAAADALGNDILEAVDATGNSVFAGGQRPVYCMQYRLAWLYGPVSVAPPPHLMRAEVRVFWLREGLTTLPTGTAGDMASYCVNNGSFLALESATGMQYFHTVYAATTVRQNTAVAL